MAWTAEDEREYQRLLAEQERRKAEAEGQRRLQEAQKRNARQSSAMEQADEGEQEFSFFRAVGGAAQDTWNNLVDLSDWMSEKRMNAVSSITGGPSYDEFRQVLREKGADENGLRVEMVEESTNPWESGTRAIVGFMVPYMGAAKATGALKGGLTIGQRVGRSIAAGTAVNLTVMDGTENNIANTLRDSFGVDNAVIDALATEEDDDLLWGRVKMAVANLPLDLVAEGVTEGLFHGVRALREVRRTNKEQRELIAVAKEDMRVSLMKAEPGKPAKGTKGEPEVAVANDAPLTSAPDELLSKAPKEGTADEMVTVHKSKVKPKELNTLDDVVTHLKEVVDDVPVGKEATLEKIAKALVENPHKALDELSIDPVKLNPEVLSDPDKILALQGSLAEIVEHVARRTGRTGKIVSNAETLRTARMLGSGPKVLTQLLKRTKGLATELTAARLIVGAHSHRLVSSVDDAIAEIKAGTAGPAWAKFTEDLGRHGLLMGVLRGAGSEIGRGLQSLQATVKVTNGTIKEGVEAAEEAAEQQAKAAAAYEEMFKDLQTDAGRLRLLQRLKDADGDLVQLQKVVRSRERGFVATVDAALVEMKGNLFSVGTSIYNVGSAAFQLGFKSINHSLAGIGLGTAAVLGRNAEIGLAARKQLYKAWATYHAPVMSFTTAMRGAINVLKRQGAEELSGIADTLGATKFAKSMQQKANDADGLIEQGWIKQDMRSDGRAIYVSPESIAKVMESAEQWPIGRFGQLGMEWFVKTAATGVNTFGSLTRMAMASFIGAPDVFAGTIAAQVGKSTKAVQIAAEEAAEAGLEGKALKDYLHARSIDLEELVADGVGRGGMDAFDAAAKDVMERSGNDLAKEVNFADDLESGWLRSLASAFEGMPIVGTLVMPFPRTPLRVMEKTILDYTPLGALKQRYRDAWNSGDPEIRGEIAARFTMTFGLATAAWNLADPETGIVVGNDGGYANTARLERGSYTIKIGDDYHEFNRLDPIGTILGLMADAREAYAAQTPLLEAAEGAGEYGKILLGDAIFDAFVWTTVQNIFNKAWMESMEGVMNVASADTPEARSAALSRVAQGTATRFVPGSGFQRQIDKWDDGVVRTSRGLVDGWIKASVGADSLPPRLDPLFGREKTYGAPERIAGYKGGPSQATKVEQELARLAFEFRAPAWKQRGVELTQLQMNRLLQLRGHTVKDGGLTLEERITKMIEHPNWETTPDAKKVEIIKKSVTPYSRKAVKALLREDEDFAFRALREETREEYKLLGRTYKEADEATLRFAEELGIKPKE